MPSTLNLPPIYLLPTHLDTERLHELEEQIPTLTYDPREAAVIIGNISKPARALFELRRRKLSFKELDLHGCTDAAPGAKRLKLSDSRAQEQRNTIKVARLKWLTDSLERGGVLPLDEYLILEVELLELDAEAKPQSPQRIISIPAAPTSSPTYSPHGPGRFRPRREADSRPPPLLQKSTSDDETSIPPVPEFLNTPYSCQRPTPVDPPNAPFVEELKRIRKARVLAGDAVGVRAYSSAVASIAAYPYPLKSQLGK